MLVALSALMLVAAGVCSYEVSRVKFNPALVTATIWLVVLILATIPGTLFPALVPETVGVFFWVGICALGFSVGWLLFRPTRGVATALVSRTALVRVHTLLVILLIFGTILDVVQIFPTVQQLGGFEAMWAGGGVGAEFRTAVLQQHQSDVERGSNLVTGFFGYLAAPGLMSCVTGALLWRDKRFLPALTPLVVIAGAAVIILDRTTFMMAVLLFVMTLGIQHSSSVEYLGSQRARKTSAAKARRLTRLLAIVLIGVVALSVLILPLVSRNAGTNRSTGLESLAQYLLTSIAGLNSGIISGTAFLPSAVAGSTVVGAYPGFGAYTFYGVFDLLRRLGLPLPYAAPPRSVDYDPVVILGSDVTTNTRTMVRSLHMDFGPLGGYVALFLLLVLCGFMGRSVRQGNIRLLGLYALLSGALAWSFFGDVMLAGFHYVFAAVCSYWILGRLAPREEGRRGSVRPTHSSAVVEDRRLGATSAHRPALGRLSPVRAAPTTTAQSGAGKHEA